MVKILSPDSLVVLWLLFSVVSILVYAFIFAWGLRSGQFSKPDYSAALPLDSHIPEDDEIEPEQQAGQEEQSSNVSL